MAARAQERPQLRRGINALGYDGIWKGEVDAPFRMADFDLIRAGGFDHVRINFFGLAYADAQGELPEIMLRRLDDVIDRALASGLSVLLVQHDNRACQHAAPDCAPKLKAFWQQVSAHYAGTRPRLAYEILNEPGGTMTAEAWNAAYEGALDVIRLREPDRLVIVGPAYVGDRYALESFRVPAGDRHLMLTVHYYSPFLFTHQGAPWSQELSRIGGLDWGSASDRAALDASFNVVDIWARHYDLPVYLGEFGVYEAAPPQARIAWTRAVAQAAERRGWGWAYWQFDHDFALQDAHTRAWNKPLLDAMMSAAGKEN